MLFRLSEVESMQHLDQEEPVPTACPVASILLARLEWKILGHVVHVGATEQQLVTQLGVLILGPK